MLTMIKRSDSAKLKACVGNSKKKEKNIEKIPSQRVTRLSKTVHLDTPRVSTAKNLKTASESGPKIVEKRKYPTRSLKISEKSTQSNGIDSCQMSSLETDSLKKNTENRIVKRADFVKLENFEKDCLCLAKQKFSIPWPARVLSIEKKKILVHFFGDKRVGYVQPSEIYDFTKSLPAIQSIALSKNKPRSFITGLNEIKLLLQINHI